MKLELAGNQVRNVQSLAELHEARAAFNGNHREHSAIFRGQRDGWSLSTSLERACLDTDEEVTLARRREAATIREFKRRFHHYAVHVPPLDHALPWLALMQHHGAPHDCLTGRTPSMSQRTSQWSTHGSIQEVMRRCG